MLPHVLAALALAAALALPTAALAAPQAPHTSAPLQVRATGGGTYQVTGSVFGTGDDGQVGGETSSGHTLQPNDHLVALPACTDSSCPWLADGTGTSGQYGPQTSCAEGDGNCWVEVVSVDTGKCAVAPVLDVGPLFIKDNWWAPTNQRTYQLPQGEPAAVAAAQGANLGYGPGISDIGLNIAANYSYAAGIDLAAGTWSAIGLPVSQGVATIQVTMLWQAGTTHDQVCGGSTGSSSSGSGNTGSGSSGSGSGSGNSGSGSGSGNTGSGSGNAGSGSGDPSSGTNATVTTDLNLRSGPSTNDTVLTVMPGGSRVTVTGAAQDGFYPVTYNGTSGWASGDYLSLDSGAPSSGSSGDGSSSGGSSSSGSSGSGSPSGAATGTATTTSALNLRSGPGTSYDVLEVMPAGASVTLTGQSQDDYLSVSYQGTSGWAAAAYLDTSGSSGSGTGASSGSGSDSGSGTGSGTDSGTGAATGSGQTATVTSSLNLRSGPGTNYDVIDVMPAGATVTLTGQSQNDYLSVSYQGTNGWAAAAYLDTSGSAGSGSGSGSGSTSSGDAGSGSGTGSSNTGSGSGSDAGASGETATVTSSLNLRSGPGTSYDVVDVMPEGATVTITGASQNDYYPVSYQGEDGWAAGSYLDIGGSSASSPASASASPSPSPSPTGGTTLTATTNLNLRSGPSTSDDVLTVIPAGATVTQTGDPQNGYAPVTYEGTSGWAYASDLQ